VTTNDDLQNSSQEKKFYKQERLLTINYNNIKHRFPVFFCFLFYSLNFFIISGHYSCVCVKLVGFSLFFIFGFNRN